MTSCQVSEYLKIGPVSNQMITAETANMKAKDVPVALVAAWVLPRWRTQLGFAALGSFLGFALLMVIAGGAAL